MRRAARPVDPRAALDRAIERLARISFLIAAGYSDRLTREGPALVAAAGVWRQAQSDLHGEIAEESPRWRLVKALHAVCVAAHRHMESLMRSSGGGAT